MIYCNRAVWLVLVGEGNGSNTIALLCIGEPDESVFTGHLIPGLPNLNSVKISSKPLYYCGPEQQCPKCEGKSDNWEQVSKGVIPY